MMLFSFSFFILKHSERLISINYPNTVTECMETRRKFFFACVKKHAFNALSVFAHIYLYELFVLLKWQSEEKRERNSFVWLAVFPDLEPLIKFIGAINFSLRCCLYDGG